MSRAFVSGARSSIVLMAVAFAFCVLLGRLFYLHVWNQEDMLRHLEGNRKTFNLIEARRGNIVDTRGNLLAVTRTSYNIGVDPHSVREADRDKLPQLARLIGKSVEEIEAAFEAKYRVGGPGGKEARMVRWVPLIKEADEGLNDRVAALKIRGIYSNQSHSRAYPAGKLAAHVLGYINKEETAVTGVERFFDYYLRGQDGWRESERDGRRRELAQFRGREVDASDGLNLELTIDQMVQHIVETEIKRLSREYQPEGVSVIVSEAASGAVLAMANYPNYDPNEFYNTEKYPISSQRNRALTDVFEPGSTFKIVPAAAALNEGIVDPNDMFSTGLARVNYRGRSLSLPSDHRTYESLSMHEVVVKSSNRGAAHLGLMLGEQRLYDYAAAFGFGEKSGFSLGGEIAGTLHPVSNWDGLTITRLPMGHAVSATPMQVHAATSVIANGGIMIQPMLAKRIFDSQGEDVLRFAPKAKRRVISTDVAKVMAQMLADVVGENGTARRAAIQHYNVAGKTGTTQKIVNGRYSNRHHVASFSGFLPADRPQLVITVVVDEPQLSGVGYGGSVAAPAFRNIAEACIAYLGIRPSHQREDFLAQQPTTHDWPRRLTN